MTGLSSFVRRAGVVAGTCGLLVGSVLAAGGSASAQSTSSADLQAQLAPGTSLPQYTTYIETLTVTNNGPDTAVNVFSRIIVPSGMTLTSVGEGGTAGRCGAYWTDPSLAADTSMEYTIVFTVGGGHGTRTFHGTTTSPTDPNPMGNTSSATFTVLPGPGE